MTDSDRNADPIRNALLVARALLEGETLTSYRVAELTGVSEPSARKYVTQAIETLGAVETRDSTGRRRAARLDGVRAEPPSPEMAMAAGFGSSLATLFEGSAMAQGLRDAVDYVIRATPNPARFDAIERKFFFVRRGGEMALKEHERGRSLKRVVDAVLKSKRLRLAYRHFDGRLDRSELVEPLSIAIYDHQLYVIGRRTDGEIKPLRFSRMERVEITSVTFRYPRLSEYDPASMFRDSFGIWYRPSEPVQDVCVRLHKRWATYAHSHQWCESQSVSETEQGVVVVLKTRVCPELEAWILGFGDEAEVLAPPQLKRAVEKRIRRLVATQRGEARKRSRSDS